MLFDRLSSGKKRIFPVNNSGEISSEICAFYFVKTWVVCHEKSNCNANTKPIDSRTSLRAFLKDGSYENYPTSPVCNRKAIRKHH